MKNYQNVVLHHLPKEIQMPAISICSSNQYSYRDADKVLEIPKWYNINYNHTKFMSIFRNFAHHKMDPNEVENFTQEQKDFLFYHRGAFTKIIRKQVCNIEKKNNVFLKLFLKCMIFHLLRLCLLVMNYFFIATSMEYKETALTYFGSDLRWMEYAVP